MDQAAVIVTRYLREQQNAAAGFLTAANAVGEGRQAAVSIVLRGTDGYGLSGPPGYGLAGPPGSGPAIPSPGYPSLTVVAVDAAPSAGQPLGDGGGPKPSLVTVERARLLTGTIDPLLLGASPGEATRLTVYCAQADRVYEVPAFEAACELLYRRGVAGATVLPGIDGVIGGRPLRARHFRHGAGAPVMVVAVGSGERIGMLLPELGGLFRHPVMTLATVLLCKRDGQFVSRPESVAAPTGAAAPDMAFLVRLSVYLSEAARHDGQPAHRALIRRLRSAGIAGAVAQRGIWGFHGDHAPHGGDHFPLHARRAPIVTTVIEAPERIGIAFDIIDALTAGRGLVTAEAVLAPLAHAVPADQGS